MGLDETGSFLSEAKFIMVFGTPFGIFSVIYGIFFYKKLTFIFLNDGIEVVDLKNNEFIEKINSSDLELIKKTMFFSEWKNKQTLNSIAYKLHNRSLELPGKGKKLIKLANKLDQVLLNLYRGEITVDKKIHYKSRRSF